MVKTLTVLLVCFLVSNASVASPFLKFGKPVEVDNVEYGRLLSEVQTIENCPIVDNEVIDFGAFEAEETLEICLFYLADALGSVAAFERVMGIASIETTSSQWSEFPNNTAYNRPNEHVYNGVYKGAVNEKMRFAMQYKRFWYRPKIFWIYVVWDEQEKPLDITVSVPGWFTL